MSELGHPDGPQVLPAARQLIGRVTFQQTFDPVSPRTIKEYVAGMGDSNPLHVDEASAAAGRHGRIVAPALFFQAVCRDVVPGLVAVIKPALGLMPAVVKMFRFGAAKFS